MKLNKKKKGFTLIELMAVIAIIAILAAVLVPSITGYVTRAKVSAVRSEARTLINAAEIYNSTAESSLLSEDSTVTNITGSTGITVKADDIKRIATDVKISTLRKLANGQIADSVIETGIADGTFNQADDK